MELYEIVSAAAEDHYNNLPSHSGVVTLYRQNVARSSSNELRPPHSQGTSSRLLKETPLEFGPHVCVCVCVCVSVGACGYGQEQLHLPPRIDLSTSSTTLRISTSRSTGVVESGSDVSRVGNDVILAELGQTGSRVRLGSRSTDVF